MDVAILAGLVEQITPAGELPVTAVDLDLDGRWLLSGLMNAHDHLDSALFPPLGTPPYASGHAFRQAAAACAADPGVRKALAVPLAERLLLGGLRNLIAGVTAVVHHGPWHRALGREAFPVRVQDRYGFAWSVEETPQLRKTYRTSDRRVPWFIHFDPADEMEAGRQLAAMREANVLRQNTVLVHALALPATDLAYLAERSLCVVWCPESNRRLLGRTADVRGLLRSGLRVGLGGDGAETGVRDLLSTLASARREAVLDDAELLRLVTEQTAVVARLVGGEIAPGGSADLVAVREIEGLLQGDRAAVDLVVSRGVARYGDPALLAPLVGEQLMLLRVDGASKALASSLARPLTAALAAQRGAEPIPTWLRGIALQSTSTRP